MVYCDLGDQFFVNSLQTSRFCNFNNSGRSHILLDHVLIIEGKHLEVNDMVKVLVTKVFDDGASRFKFLGHNNKHPGMKAWKWMITFSIDSSILFRRLSMRKTYWSSLSTRFATFR